MAPLGNEVKKLPFCQALLQLAENVFQEKEMETNEELIRLVVHRLNERRVTFEERFAILEEDTILTIEPYSALGEDRYTLICVQPYDLPPELYHLIHVEVDGLGKGGSLNPDGCVEIADLPPGPKTLHFSCAAT